MKRQVKNYLSFVLILFGIILLAGDTDNFTFFCISKIFGIFITFLGCIMMPESFWH